MCAGFILCIHSHFSGLTAFINCLHSNCTISLQTHVNVKCCDLQLSNDVWLCFEPQDETNMSLMQAVNFHCTWLAYWDFELIVSLEFDKYFRPQICATYEMWLGILLRQAVEYLWHNVGLTKTYPQNFPNYTLIFFLFHVKYLGEKSV